MTEGKKTGFQNLSEGFLDFIERAVHVNTPPNVKAVAEGAFYTGCQVVLVLMQEFAQELDASRPTPEEVEKRMAEFYTNLFAESQAYFIAKKAQQGSMNKPSLILPPTTKRRDN